MKDAEEARVKEAKEAETRRIAAKKVSDAEIAKAKAEAAEIAKRVAAHAERERIDNLAELQGDVDLLTVNMGVEEFNVQEDEFQIDQSEDEDELHEVPMEVDHNEQTPKEVFDDVGIYR